MCECFYNLSYGILDFLKAQPIGKCLFCGGEMSRFATIIVHKEGCALVELQQIFNQNKPEDCYCSWGEDS